MKLNCKPGDVAVFIADPGFEGTPQSNVGRKVLIGQALTLAAHWGAGVYLNQHGPAWLCTPLQPIWSSTELECLKRNLLMDEFYTADRYLYPLPPPDEEDLWKETSTPADHRPMEELAQHLKDRS